MAEAFICDYIRTPIGRFGGALSSIRTDDLGALPLKELQKRNPDLDWEAVDDLIYGCVNQQMDLLHALQHEQSCSAAHLHADASGVPSQQLHRKEHQGSSKRNALCGFY